MDSLLAVVIHDAKNNLNALNVKLGEALREAPSPALDAAREMAVRINVQLVELLALYRAGDDSLRLAIEDHDLADFCADVVSELMIPAGATATIETQSPIGTQAWAFDAYQVMLVLQDALRNALRHAQQRVSFGASSEPGGGIRFTVSDDGPGFPATVLAGDAAPMNQNSSGLGLRFAQLIACRHATPGGRHGHIELDNPAPGGARFSLIIP